MRSRSTTRSSPSTATRKKKRERSTTTAITGYAPTSARRTASAGACSQARPASTSERSGTADLPGVGSGELSDSRHFTINLIQADGWWRIGARSLLQAGLEWREQSGRYDYEDEAEFELLFLTPGAATTPERTRSLHLRPDGHQYGAYLNWRLEIAPAVTSDLGVRFDRSTLAESDPSQWSPRAVLMWQPGDRTRLRLGWGHYYQAQSINELQVPDGESMYQPMQRATHLVASVERDLTRVLDAAPRGLSQGIRPSLRPPREPAEHRRRAAGAQARPDPRRAG